MKFCVVAGARPNFVKVAPLLREMRRYPDIRPLFIHTGQHYDVSMAESFFQDLEIPLPDVSLGVGSGSHAYQTAEVMKRLEPILEQQTPDVVMVVGDVNSTLAGAVTAAKLNIAVAHVEAGLRSFDRTMPEEINRTLTDRISDYLFVSESSGMENLRREGVEDHKLFFVGNVMIDSLEAARCMWQNSDVVDRMGLEKGKYAVLTLHRPSNVDDKEVFTAIIQALSDVARGIPIVFPTHPRTLNRIKEFALEEYFDSEARCAEPRAQSGSRMIFCNPMSYLDFVALVARARLVLTDSGGIQEESTILGIPCLTLRDSTERPVTLKQGTNRLVGNSPNRIRRETQQALNESRVQNLRPPLWDGKAAERIIKILHDAWHHDARHKRDQSLVGGGSRSA